MTALPKVYSAEAAPVAVGSIPVTVVILAKDEAANINRAVESSRWAERTLVVDSGSADNTAQLAELSGANVIRTHWRGYGPQREFALRHESVVTPWVLFLDADEYVSEDLASEIAHRLEQDGLSYSAYWQRNRLIFQGRWIAHSGWYPGARWVRLMQPSLATYPDAVFSEHPVITGRIGHLETDLVDDDQKPFVAWLEKHARYAALEAQRRNEHESAVPHRYETRRRRLLKRVADEVPGRPLAQFVYMYLLKRGFLDGREGLRFAFYHMWFQQSVRDIQRLELRRKCVGLKAREGEGKVSSF